MSRCTYEKEGVRCKKEAIDNRNYCEEHAEKHFDEVNSFAINSKVHLYGFIANPNSGSKIKK